MHTFLSFHVLKPPLCLTGSHPIAAVGLHPESSNTQAAAGHTIWTWPGVGILSDWGCCWDCCWGGGRRLQDTITGWCVRDSEAAENKYTPLPLHPSASRLWYDGKRGRLNTQLSSAIISDGWSPSRASMAWLVLTHLNVSVYWCVCLIQLCVRDRGRTDRENMTVPGISRWCKLITFFVLDNRWKGTKEEIGFL